MERSKGAILRGEVVFAKERNSVEEGAGRNKQGDEDSKPNKRDRHFQIDLKVQMDGKPTDWIF